MGFDPQKIPSIRKSWTSEEIRGSDTPLNKVLVRFHGEDINLDDFQKFLVKNPKLLSNFCPSVGWKGHIELEDGISTK